MTFGSLENSIATDNPIRFIDAFVENIALKALGFEVQTLKTEGRPSFNTKIFLKLYLSGYLNGLRSSCKLEKECLRNTQPPSRGELDWVSLLGGVCVIWDAGCVVLDTFLFSLCSTKKTRTDGLLLYDVVSSSEIN